MEARSVPKYSGLSIARITDITSIIYMVEDWDSLGIKIRSAKGTIPS